MLDDVSVTGERMSDIYVKGYVYLDVLMSLLSLWRSVILLGIVSCRALFVCCYCD